MTTVELAAVIVAVVQAVKTQFPQVIGIWTILLAAVLGILAGWAGIAGLDWVGGLYAGLAAVGVVTVASRVSGK